MLLLPNGFLPQEDPLQYLPNNFTSAAWNKTCDDLPELLQRGLVTRTVLELPVIGQAELEHIATNPRLAECAMRKLSFLVSALVHPYEGREVPTTHIPQNISVPLCYLAERLGRKPILSYASYALNNWRRIDPDSPIHLDNIEIIDGFLKTPDENWFIIIHVAIENKARDGIEAIQRAMNACLDRDNYTLSESLYRMSCNLYALLTILRRMPDGCSTDYYWNKVRPFIFFFDEVIYEGVEELRGAPQKLHGETGAQSSVVPLFDAALGIGHQPTELIGHIRSMRAYMPPEHRALIGNTEELSTIRESISASGDRDHMLRYDECLSYLHMFRSQHLEWAQQYIANKDERPFGTGGTYFMPFLEQMARETHESMFTPPAT